MRNPNYVLVSRTGICYFRYPLPKHLHPAGKASTIKVSLSTRDPREALRLSRFLSYEAHTKCQQCMRVGMNHSEIRAVLHRHFATLLGQQRSRIDADGPLSALDRSVMASSLAVTEEAIAGDGFFAASVSGDDQLTRFIQKYALPITHGTKQHAWLRDQLQHAYRDYINDVVAYDASVRRYDFSPVQDRAPHINVDAPQNAIRVVDAIDAFIAEQLRSRAWKNPRTEEGRRSQLELLKELLHPVAHMETVTKHHARGVKDALVKLPKNRSKSPQFRDKTIGELLVLEHQSGMSVGTINEYITTYSTFFNWSADQGYVEENWFSGLALTPEKKSRSDQRQPFTDDALSTIQHALLTDFDGRRPKASHKWASLIAMYTGARAGEVCQLLLSDVRDVDGVLCFDINDEEENKRLKTEASIRRVPVHSRLLELGLMEFVTGLSSKRLFPDYPLSDNADASRNLSTWFNEALLPKLGLKTKQHVLHSLRHSMNTKLHHADVNPSIVKAITGHTDDSMSTGTYFSAGFKPEQLKAAIEKFRFDQ
jgi:integrase